MVAYTFYETDNRVMRYAEALAARGDQVDVLSLQHVGHEPVEKINGVTVRRIQKRALNEKGKFSYLTRMLAFFSRSSWFLTKKTFTGPYDLIHVHSVPDFEVFSALIPKLCGTKVILDVHDIVPEFYAAKFGVEKESIILRLLKLIERWSSAFSDHVIISNHLWEKLITARSVRAEKCSTCLNYPDSKIFRPGMRTRNGDGRFIMVYPGTINWHQGLDVAVKAFDIIKDQAPEAEFHIYGDGNARTQLAQLIEERSLQNRIKLMGLVPIRQMASIMANADLGIVPKRNDPFGGSAFSTKIFEFMALGVPIIAANTVIDTFYFNDSLVKFFQAGDEHSLAHAMLTMMNQPSLRKELAENASTYIAHQAWDIKRDDYFKLIDKLIGKKE